MKTLRWASVILAPIAFAAPAVAGDYHTGATLLCSQCHIMHYSQGHGYNPDGSGFFLNPGAAGPYAYLLRDDVNTLCLSCHDQAGIAPDVLGAANGGNSPGDIRLGGYLNRLGIEGLAPTGHTLDALDTAPGSNPPWKPEDDNGAGEGLNCVNCHHQHGYAGPTSPSNYRNLKYDPGNRGFATPAAVTYNHDNIGVFDPTRDVFERAATAYDEGDVDWAEPDETESAIAYWCGGCHDDFHSVPGVGGGVGQGGVGGTGGVGAWEHFTRHPNSGVDIGDLGGGHSSLGQFAGTTNKVKVMSASGDWSGATDDVTPTCVSCHKSHGNGNAFGLIYRSGTGTVTENGDSNGTQLEHLCGQCHVQASFFNNP